MWLCQGGGGSCTGITCFLFLLFLRVAGVVNENPVELVLDDLSAASTHTHTALESNSL